MRETIEIKDMIANDSLKKIMGESGIDNLIGENNIENPIKDNRIVYDYTFATRLKSFLKLLPIEYVLSDLAIKEEFDYLSYVAQMLIEYQKATCEDGEEIKYFKNLWKS